MSELSQAVNQKQNSLIIQSVDWVDFLLLQDFSFVSRVCFWCTQNYLQILFCLVVSMFVVLQ